MINTQGSSEHEQVATVLREMDLMEKLLQEARDAVNRVAHKSQQIRRSLMQLKDPNSVAREIRLS